jgi:hypothetical protein
VIANDAQFLRRSLLARQRRNGGPTKWVAWGEVVGEDAFGFVEAGR